MLAYGIRILAITMTGKSLNEHGYLMASKSVTVKLNLSFALNFKVLKTEVLLVHVRLLLTLGSSKTGVLSSEILTRC